MKKEIPEKVQISIAEAAIQAKEQSKETELKIYLMFKGTNESVLLADEAESNVLKKEGYEPIASYKNGKGMLIKNGVEYSADTYKEERERRKGKNRNKTCVCGSGKKWKNCCGKEI